MTRSQSGFAYIAAVVFLVVIAGISVALLRLTDTQQTTVNQALLGARAGLAVRAGIEWVVHRPTARCAGSNVGASNAITPVGQVNTLTTFQPQSGFRVTVRCTYRTYREGEETDASGALQPVEKRIYRVDAVACNGAGTTCPDSNATTAARPDYVERARTASFCVRTNGTPCYG